ncbi:MAG: hypothetical protein IH987_07570, partial [Planctomycetes bacterium]|nr:hypothetical protein [Planctomycetota bacterium]
TGPCDETCPNVWDPVCGIDGVTYSNACFAELAGVPIAHLGECGAVCGGLGPYPPCDLGTFCKFPPGACDDPAVAGECTAIPTICPAVWIPVCGCDGNTYGNECEAAAAGVSIDHPGECTGGECAATRVLSDPDPSYCTGVPKVVRILLTPPDSVTAVALNDTPPAGWIVSHISHGGTFDAINGKVKWGPFFPPNVPSEVTYDVTSAAGDVGVVCFAGEISLDGVNSAVCGDDCIAGEACCPFMDADLSQPQCATCPAADCASAAGSCADGRISLTELAGYACAWMTGCNDDLSGMTRAAFVWRNGECYCWDDADLNWHPTTCPASDSGCCTPSGRGSASTGGSARAVLTWDNLKKIVRSSGAGGFNGTREIEIALTVSPPPGTSATAVALWIPRAWTVVTASDGGQWDEIHRKVKWGPTFGDLAQSMTLTVRWVPGDALPVARRSVRGGLASGFEGVVSFDGVNQPISMR